jgi:hypothetical protein
MDVVICILQGDNSSADGIDTTTTYIRELINGYRILARIF